MKEFVGANWVFLIPIMFLSVFGVTLIIERCIYYSKIRSRGHQKLMNNVRTWNGIKPIAQENIPQKKNANPAEHLFLYAVSSPVRTVPHLFKQRLEALRNRYLDKLERSLSILPGIANLSTLMGLFGTISGMITAFSRMTETGNSDPYILAGGISRALLTTAAGLAVAIPVLLAHHLMEASVDRHAEKMEEVVSECIAISGIAYARQRESKKN